MISRYTGSWGKVKISKYWDFDGHFGKIVTFFCSGYYCSHEKTRQRQNRSQQETTAGTQKGT